ncbi:PREDICTED: ribonuclease P protein subunit p20 [Nicrophorus vespilloides]|uniref:Ribonuclease P protein subunit p20 n=1 Tax=Nicrophorus vespilloides TaxID=110193 RepID=A0ABM1N923_NICVS|nr:PREDICTED: ribonuclease P protein subunit p20 [Nicrophorus vespilloides]
MADQSVKSESSSNGKKANGQRNPSKNHNLKKRAPQKPQVAENVIYVSTKTHIKALLERCTKLINKDSNEIIIYCLGAAIQRGILLALQICEKHISYDCATETLTTNLIDDLEPATDDADYELVRRQNSALRIRIFKKDLLS